MGNSLLNPLTAGGAVYLITSNSVTAVDAGTGIVGWTTYISPAGARLAVSGGRVFVTRTICELAALDAMTGRVLWHVRPGADCPQTAPVIDQGLATEVSAGSAIDAFDVITGKVAWHLAGSFEYAPAAANGVLFVSDSTSALYAVDAAVGSVLWKRTLSLRSVTPIALANGVLYYGYAGGVAFVDATSGSLLGSVPVRGDFDHGRMSPIVVDGMVFVATHVLHHPHGQRGFVYGFGLPSGR
jgi:outer membrane protein assembly factor BamB